MIGQRVRVLKISDVFLPRINGVSTSIDTVRYELENRGHEVSLVAPRYESEPSNGVVRVPARRVVGDPEDRMMKVRVLRRLVRDFASRIDLIHVHTPFIAHYEGIRMARRWGVPVVGTYHTHFEEYLHHYVPFVPKPGLRALARRQARRQCSQLNQVIVPSRQMAEVLEGYGARADLRVIPTGLSPAAFEPGDGSRFRQAHGIDEDRPTLVHVGRLAFEKNIDFLLRVVAEVRRSEPRILLILAGEGPAARSLRRLVARLGLTSNVVFVGYLSRLPDLLDCYRAGMAFVFASRTETQGLVLLEAMAQSVPVVSTASLGTKDIVLPRRGALVAQESSEDFSRKVLFLLENPEYRLARGEEARRFARTWSSSAMANRLLAVYRGMLAGN
jgi:glycosyltransferase involved in cell wall biosynthesis